LAQRIFTRLGVSREQKVIKGHLYTESYITKYTTYTKIASSPGPGWPVTVLLQVTNLMRNLIQYPCYFNGGVCYYGFDIAVPSHTTPGGVQPVHPKSTGLTQLILGPYVAQIGSLNTPKSGVINTRVLHRLATLKHQNMVQIKHMFPYEIDVGDRLGSASR